MGERIDLILQAGDLGVYPEMTSLDKATQRHAQADATELGFSEHFLHHDAEVAAILARTSCDLVFVRGNHEDHAWLDAREAQSTDPIFPIDAYHRIWCLKTGEPYTFRSSYAEVVTVVGVGRVGSPVGEREHRKAKYIQQDELERIYRDARCGRFHPANSMTVHEVVGKTALGVLGEPGLRWG